jgi:hypothetical protein
MMRALVDVKMVVVDVFTYIAGNAVGLEVECCALPDTLNRILSCAFFSVLINMCS